MSEVEMPTMQAAVPAPQHGLIAQAVEDARIREEGSVPHQMNQPAVAAVVPAPMLAPEPVLENFQATLNSVEVPVAVPHVGVPTTMGGLTVTLPGTMPVSMPAGVVPVSMPGSMPMSVSAGLVAPPGGITLPTGVPLGGMGMPQIPAGGITLPQGGGVVPSPLQSLAQSVLQDFLLTETAGAPNGAVGVPGVQPTLPPLPVGAAMTGLPQGMVQMGQMPTVSMVQTNKRPADGMVDAGPPQKKVKKPPTQQDIENAAIFLAMPRGKDRNAKWKTLNPETKEIVWDENKKLEK